MPGYMPGNKPGSPADPGYPPSAFQLKPWLPQRFQRVRTLQSAERNQGEVTLFEDNVENDLVAVKVMPIVWVCKSEAEFMHKHPKALYQPWFDIMTCARLTELGFPHVCAFKGVYVSDDKLLFAQGFANGGDLNDWVDSSRKKSASNQNHAAMSCYAIELAKRQRERSVCMIIKKLLEAVQQLHGKCKLAHRDLSLENVMLHWPNGGRNDETTLELRLVNFGMSRPNGNPNWVADDVNRPAMGKASYTAPELHDPKMADSQEAVDIFAAGVILYCLLCEDYPWLRTTNGEDKYHDLFLEADLDTFLQRRKIGTSRVAADVITPSAAAVLKDLWQHDPRKRGTLGDPQTDPRSVWRHQWWSGNY